MKGISAAILSAISFAVMTVAVNAVGSSVPTLTVSFLRVSISLVVIAIVVIFVDHRILRPSVGDLKEYALIGFLLTVSIALFNGALALIPSQNVAFLGQLTTPSVFILSYLILKERATKKEIAAIGIALLGFAVMNPLQPSLLMGNIMVVANVFFFATSIVLMRMVDKSHSIETIFWIMLFASIFLSPATLIYGFGTSFPFGLLVLVGFANAGAYLFMTYGLEKIQADTLSAITTVVMPLATIILAFLFLSSLPEKNILIGGVVIVSAGLLLRKGLPKEK